MPLIVSVVLILLAAGSLLAQEAGWRTAKWGMTPAEVLASVPGSARVGEINDPVQIAKVQIGDTDFRVRFRFCDGKLCRVLMDLDLGDLPAKLGAEAARIEGGYLEERMAVRYGAPVLRRVDSRINISRIEERSLTAVWKSGNAGVILRTLETAGLPSVLVEFRSPATSEF